VKCDFSGETRPSVTIDVEMLNKRGQNLSPYT